VQAGAHSERVDAVGALRDAGFTGLVAFGLFLPLIGFQTAVNGSNDLFLTTRWPFLFALVAIIAACRFAYSFAVAPWLAQRGRRPVRAAPSAWRGRFGKLFIPFAIGFVVVYPVIILLTVGFGGALSAWLLAAYDYVPNAVQTPHALLGIRLCATVFSAVPFVIGLVCLALYPIGRELGARVQRELAERRAVQTLN